MIPRPKMFIGSSSEGLRVARELQAELERDFDGTVWSQGVFGLSGYPLESLLTAARQVRFATLVLTPDDLLTKRDTLGRAPRDNVVFEAGLFMGALGRESTFLMSCRDDNIDLPTDLTGLTHAQYNRRPDLRSAVGPAATDIRNAAEAALATYSPWAFDRAAFEQPRNHAAVDRKVIVRGRSSARSESSEVWAVVTSLKPPGHYHPQAAPLRMTNEGRFEATVYLGPPESSGTYTLLLVRIDPADSDYFRRYCSEAAATNTYSGLKLLPFSARILDAIEVIRT
jgi:Predicted nucleotide-binding protein containing TIR-like domain